MGEKNVLFKTEEKDATFLMEFWVEGDYVYFSYDVSTKKGTHLDVITEQSTQVLPEILAKQIFWDRLKQRIRTQMPEILTKLGINSEIEFVGEPELRLSNTLERGSGIRKLFAAVSYDFHNWTLEGFTVVFRVKKPQ